MTFEILDSRNRTDFEQNHMAMMTAIRGEQFGREIYSSILKFKDLEDFLEVFPEVQRDIQPRRVASLRKYILSGLLKGKAINLRFFSAVTVTCKGYIFYDEKNLRMAVDTNNTKLSVNDGQHRMEAIKTAISYLEKEFLKSKDKQKTERIRAMIDEISEMTIPVVVFSGLSEKEEKQLFFDLNNLAQRPSRNINIKLNQVDLYSRLAREIAVESRYLKHYGVEYEKMSIQANNPNTILLTTIHASIKELLKNDYKNNKNFLNENSFEAVKKDALITFEKMLGSLPPDIDSKGKYIIEKSFALKAISRFICDATTQFELMLTDEEISSILKESDWTNNIDTWEKYGGFSTIKNNMDTVIFGGGYSGGFKAVYSMLMEKAIKLREGVK